MKKQIQKAYKSNRTFSIRTKVLLIILGILIVSVGIVLIWNFVYVAQTNNRSFETFKYQMDSMAREMYSTIDNTDNLLLSLATEGVFKEPYDEYVKTGNADELKNSVEQKLAVKMTSNHMDLIAFYLTDATSNENLFISSDYQTEKQFRSSIFNTMNEAIKNTQYSGYYRSGEMVYCFRKLYDILDVENGKPKQYGTVVVAYPLSTIFGNFRSITGNNAKLKLEVNSIPLISSNLINEDFVDYKTSSTLATEYSGSIYSFIQSTNRGKILVSGVYRNSASVLKYDISMDNSVIVFDSMQSIWYILSSVLLIGALLVIVAKVLYRDIASPLKNLKQQMFLLQQGNFGVQAMRTRNDEIGEIVDSFNVMSTELETFVNKVYEEEILSRDAQIKAMQSVINPHFLYNTLDLINWKARKAGNQEVSTMIISLAKLLDSNMDRKNERIISLMDELEILEHYTKILQIRFENKVQIEFDLDDDTLDLKVPKLILQPVIENAIVHGIEPNSGGTIRVRSYVFKGVLRIEVEDNGVGMPPEKRRELQELLEDNNSHRNANSQRIGLLNVHNRIRLICGNDYGMSIKSNRNGTLIILKIPSDLGDRVETQDNVRVYEEFNRQKDLGGQDEE